MCEDFVVRLAFNAFLNAPYSLERERERERDRERGELVASYKPRVLFVEHHQTVQNQIRRHKTGCLIRFSTVCLNKFL